MTWISKQTKQILSVKVVTVQNVPLGILRLLLQTAVIAFVVIHQLWYARGYQEFAEVEASVTTKVKGFSM